MAKFSPRSCVRRAVDASEMFWIARCLAMPQLFHSKTFKITDLWGVQAHAFSILYTVNWDAAAMNVAWLDISCRFGVAFEATLSASLVILNRVQFCGFSHGARTFSGRVIFQVIRCSLPETGWTTSATLRWLDDLFPASCNLSKVAPLLLPVRSPLSVALW